MKVLVGCEESQAVTIELRKLGHEAFSCDILPCSGGHPEWHLQMDVFKAIALKKWDLLIAHPPCTYLSSSGLHWNKKRPERALQTLDALEFVRKILNCGIPKIALENPVGCIGTQIRPSDQIIQPYNFGDDASKQTCLWLVNLPSLNSTKFIPPRLVWFVVGKPWRKDLGNMAVRIAKAKILPGKGGLIKPTAVRISYLQGQTGQSYAQKLTPG